MALDAHQTSRTRLLIADRRIAGFYSLASAQVELSQRDRRRVGLDPVRVPAALVTWIAKDRRAEIDGKLLLLHATATARRAAELPASRLVVAALPLELKEVGVSLGEERLDTRVFSSGLEFGRVYDRNNLRMKIPLLLVCIPSFLIFSRDHLALNSVRSSLVPPMLSHCSRPCRITAG